MSSSAPPINVAAHSAMEASPIAVASPIPPKTEVAPQAETWPEPVFPDPADLISEIGPKEEVWPEPVFPDPKDLISDDGHKLETPFHRANMNLLVDSLTEAWSDRQDFYTGANMFIYYSSAQVKNKDYRGPDFFVVNRVSRQPARAHWAIWEEGGRYPDLIVELTSPSTRHEDFGAKFQLYEQIFHTREYFCYEPGSETFQGWRLVDRHYQPIPLDAQGRMFSEELRMSVGIWTGACLEIAEPSRFLRFFDAEGNVVPTGKEREAVQVQVERQRADNEAQRADNEAQRADNEAQRADNAEKQLKELRALIAKLQGDSASKGGAAP